MSWITLVNEKEFVIVNDEKRVYRDFHNVTFSPSYHFIKWEVLLNYIYSLMCMCKINYCVESDE